MLNSKNRYLSNEKNTFAENSRVEPTIFLMEKLSFSLKLFLAIFNGNPSLRLSEVLFYLLVESSVQFDTISCVVLI